MAAFLAVESRIENPIMPLRILRLRGLIGASAVRGFLVTGMYSTFFLGTAVHGARAPLRGAADRAAFLPWTLTVAALSLGVAARLVARFGPLRVMVFGMLVVMGGLTTFHAVGPHTGFFPTIFVASFLIGLGIGSAFMPLLTIAMADVPPADAGLGSGITNVSQQVAGALGLALLSTIATNHTKGLLATHHSLVSSLLAGYHVAFLVGVGAVGIGLLVALAVLRTPAPAKVEPADEVHRSSWWPSRPWSRSRRGLRKRWFGLLVSQG